MNHSKVFLVEKVLLLKSATLFQHLRGDDIERIAGDAPCAAELIRERVSRALDLIAGYPGIGTPGSRRGYRRYPVAPTGHVLGYRATRRGIVIMLWYRARQNIRP